MRRGFNFILFLVSILCYVSLSFSAVEVFSSYNTKINFTQDNIIKIHKDLTLQNVFTTAFVPGGVEIKIFKNGDNFILNKSSLKVYDRYKNKLNFKLDETSSFYLLTINIFQPLPPGFKYKFEYYYELKYNPSGIIFKNMQIPLKENLTIPIKSGIFEVFMENGKYLSYVNYKDDKTIFKKNYLKYEIGDKTPETLEIEYSSFPFISFMNLKGSYIFWSMINIILILILFVEIKMEFKKLKGSKRGRKSKK